MTYDPGRIERSYLDQLDLLRFEIYAERRLRDVLLDILTLSGPDRSEPDSE